MYLWAWQLTVAVWYYRSFPCQAEQRAAPLAAERVWNQIEGHAATDRNPQICCVRPDGSMIGSSRNQGRIALSQETSTANYMSIDSFNFAALIVFVYYSGYTH